MSVAVIMKPTALTLVRLKIKDDEFLLTQLQREGVNPTKRERGKATSSLGR